ADRARRLRDHLPRAQCVGELAQTTDRSNRPIRGRGGDATMPGDVVAEAQHLLLAGNGGERAIEMHVGDEEMEGVRSEVERGDAHRARRYPGAYPVLTIARREI